MRRFDLATYLSCFFSVLCVATSTLWRKANLRTASLFLVTAALIAQAPVLYAQAPYPNYLYPNLRDQVAGCAINSSSAQISAAGSCNTQLLDQAAEDIDEALFSCLTQYVPEQDKDGNYQMNSELVSKARHCAELLTTTAAKRGKKFHACTYFATVVGLFRYSISETLKDIVPNVVVKEQVPESYGLGGSDASFREHQFATGLRVRWMQIKYRNGRVEANPRWFLLSSNDYLLGLPVIGMTKRDLDAYTVGPKVERQNALIYECVGNIALTININKNGRVRAVLFEIGDDYN